MNAISGISIKNSVTFPKHNQIHFLTGTLECVLRIRQLLPAHLLTICQAEGKSAMKTNETWL